MQNVYAACDVATMWREKVYLSDLAQKVAKECGGKASHKPHVTLIYSAEKSFTMDYEEARKIVSPHILFTDLNFTGVDAFEDRENPGTWAIVLCIEPTEKLMSAHEWFREHGARHSFEPYTPHMSVVYGVEGDEMKEKAFIILKAAIQELNEAGCHFSSMVVEPINENWVKEN